MNIIKGNNTNNSVDINDIIALGIDKLFIPVAQEPVLMAAQYLELLGNLMCPKDIRNKTV